VPEREPEIPRLPAANRLEPKDGEDARRMGELGDGLQKRRLDVLTRP
jgi:hypothetical protein